MWVLRQGIAEQGLAIQGKQVNRQESGERQNLASNVELTVGRYRGRTGRNRPWG